MPEKIGHIRSFIAVSLPGHVKRELGRLQARLKSAGIQASWPRTETLHLTLKFLGDIPENQIPSIREGLSRTAARAFCFDLTAGGLGVFPGIKKPRVIWAGTGGRTDLLEKVFQDLEGELELLGFPRENRRFSPHFTLARVKREFSPKALIRLIQACRDIRSRPFPVSSLDLFHSRLLPKGAVHTKIFSAEFSGKEISG